MPSLEGIHQPGLRQAGDAGDSGVLPANSVANTELAQVPAHTMKGNPTDATANVADMTVAQILTLLGLGTAALAAVGDFVASAGTQAFGLSLLAITSAKALAEALGSEIPTQGTNLGDADATISIAGGSLYVLPAFTLSTNRVITLSTIGSPIVGDTIAIFRRGIEASTLTVQDDAATSLLVIPAGIRMAGFFRWSGSHYTLSSAVRIQ